MEEDIKDSLEELGCPNAPTEDVVKALVKDGLSCLEFYRVVEWLTSELQGLLELECCVTPVTDTEDSASFLLEVRTFLKELQCPYDCLMAGPISECLAEEQDRIIFLDYLCAELHCAKISTARRLLKRQALEIEMDSTPMASSLSSILKTLGIDPGDQDCEALFSAINSKVEEIISKNPEAVKEPVFTEELTESQSAELQDIQKEVLAEYTTRREMLLTRLDVVLESFKWGEGVKGKEEKLNGIFQPLRKEMKVCPDVKISDILAAREDILLLEKTSSAEVRKNMQSSLYKVLIPEVPDRGGRANEMRPPVEMPSWQKRSNDPRGGRGGGFRGRGGGGRGDHRGSRGDHHGGGGGGYRGGSSHHKGSSAYDAMGSYGST